MARNGKMKLSAFAWASVVAAAVAVAALLLFCGGGVGGGGAASLADRGSAAGKSLASPGGRGFPEGGRGRPAKDAADDPGDAEAAGEAADDAEVPKTDEELREEEDERKVETFDGIVDKWMERDGGEVSMKDMDAFVASFRSVPAERKEECLRRAMNLVSDDHVLLLAGILFDKTTEEEYVELVFNDILNRDESVKKLILPMIYKDRDHPCWADAAWILDATGEIPNQKKEKTE